MKLSKKWKRDEAGNYSLKLNNGRTMVVSNGGELNTAWEWEIVPRNFYRWYNILCDPQSFRDSYDARRSAEGLIRAMQGVEL